MAAIRTLVAGAFSLMYLALYPMLLGSGGTIYHHPAWSPFQAAAYVLGGVFLQAGFCLANPRTAQVGWLLAQMAIGALYGVVVLKGMYQS